MIDKVFFQILNMSFASSFAIIFVLFARLILKKVPKVFSYTLWSVVLFRLICPVSFESTFSLLPINVAPVPIATIYSESPQISTGITAFDHAIHSILPVPSATASSNPLQIWIFVGEIVWLAGMALLIGHSVASLMRLRQKLIGAVRLQHNIYLGDHITTPFVFGLISPKIYLPSTLSERERGYIILHEQMHIRHFDYIIKILAFFALTIHWFNPFVWVAFFFAGKDMEMTCDESVIKQLGSDICQEYSASLLGLATGKKIIAGVPLSFGEGSVKGRIKNVMAYKKSALLATATAAIIVVAVCFGLLTNPKSRYDTYTVEHVTISIPTEYHELVVVDNVNNDEWMHQVIALYYRPAYEFHTDFGLLFSIKRCNQEQMQSILENGGDGISFEATDGKNYYFVYEPTDVQWRSPEEYSEYKKVRDAVTISFGNLQNIQ